MKTKHWMVALAGALALAGGSTETAAAANESAACVGAFSSFFAHDGFGVHRSDLAREFAREDRPAGQNVYSSIAQVHGTLTSCFEQT